jgi:hypothetical protein
MIVDCNGENLLHTLTYTDEGEDEIEEIHASYFDFDTPMGADILRLSSLRLIPGGK